MCIRDRLGRELFDAPLRLGQLFRLLAHRLGDGQALFRLAARELRRKLSLIHIFFASRFGRRPASGESNLRDSSSAASAQAAASQILPSAETKNR